MEDVNGMLLGSSFLTLPIPRSSVSPQIAEEQSACTNAENGSPNSLKLFSDIVGYESRIPYQFDYDTIRVATDDFSDANIIPQSAFLSMYKGMLESGQRIGIARPYTGSACRSSKDVLSLLVLLQHENLLKLIGYYIKEATPFFVFELASNGSLDRFIFDPYSTVLGWNERYKIILGVARVLLYLHKHSPNRIIHGDVGPENILLDESFEPKLSDFRFARCLINNTACIDTGVIHGTTEYMAPEYKFHGRLSTKSDVFSFGMLILKTISGCRTYTDVPAANKNFLQYAWTNWWAGASSNIVDPRLDADSTSIRRFIHIGLLCTQPNAIDRPTMEDVNGMLLGSSFLTLPIPKSSVSPQITEEQSACTNENGSPNSLKLFSDIVGYESRIPYQFDYDTIRVATDDFSDANIIPQSAFLSMYKGMLESGQRIGIARPFTGSACRSSKDVLSLLVLLQHENLLKLIGYYIKEATPFFVFELASNGSLDRFIFDPYSTVLGWNERYKIILGVARVLLYLHKHSPNRIIHGDVGPENILLDENFEPKLSDFRFARCLINNTACIDTSVIHCTTEYMAPEYKFHGRLSTKSDVFSFGMLILKIISGCRTYTDVHAANKNFLQYAWTNWWAGASSNIVDPRLDADSTSIRRFIHIGLLCTQPNAIDRPTMEDVNGMLLGSSFLSLPIPKSSVSPQITEEQSACTNAENGSPNSLKLFSDIVGYESRIPYQFDYDTIRVATDDFSDANIIPLSAFLSMYKGMLESGQRIGIARPYTGSACGSSKDVLSLLVLLQHENLLKLIGYYIKEATPFFVFELAANGSLDRIIFDPNSIVLGWNERYKIILGVARVLLYLHKHSPHQIIHGDVRPENILLDENFEPKLSDFRFARCLINNTVCIDTNAIHCTTKYMAPEYTLHGHLSTKSDVFSFGMLILKTISGCRTYNDIPAANKNFLQYAWTNWWTETYSDIVDPRLDADSTSIRRFIHIGLLCTQPNAIDRPTMEDVNGMLLGSSFLTLPIPKSSVSPQITEDQSACTNVQEVFSSINYDYETVDEFVLELEAR